ncbi:MAG: ParB-like partition protein, partial [Thermovirga lienii]
ARKKVLGRGLEAIFSGAEAPPKEPAHMEREDGLLDIPIEDLFPSPLQPRKSFDNASLKSLAASIKECGVIQPILARSSKGKYEIVAGERRWKAAKMAGLKTVPVKVINADDLSVMELSLVENLQREDLSPLEAALGVKELINRFSLTQEQAAKKLGWSRVAVTNKLRLLNLPQEVLDYLGDGRISEGHARALLALKREEECIRLARLAAEKGLSVRELEDAVRRTLTSGTSRKKSVRVMEIPESAKRISEKFGIKVKLKGARGKLQLTLDGLTPQVAMRLFDLLEARQEELFPEE